MATRWQVFHHRARKQDGDRNGTARVNDDKTQSDTGWYGLCMVREEREKRKGKDVQFSGDRDRRFKLRFPIEGGEGIT